MANLNNGATVGFEDELWAAADKMRGGMNASEYKHVALGLIFLKYISDALEAMYQKLRMKNGLIQKIRINTSLKVSFSAQRCLLKVSSSKSTM